MTTRSTVAGDDLSGDSTIDGGGGDWTDTIEVNLGGVGPSASGPASGGWTVDITSEHFETTSNSITGDDLSGTIASEDGTVSFDNIS